MEYIIENDLNNLAKSLSSLGGEIAQSVETMAAGFTGAIMGIASALEPTGLDTGGFCAPAFKVTADSSLLSSGLTMATSDLADAILSNASGTVGQCQNIKSYTDMMTFTGGFTITGYTTCIPLLECNWTKCAWTTPAVCMPDFTCGNTYCTGGCDWNGWHCNWNSCKNQSCAGGWNECAYTIPAICYPGFTNCSWNKCAYTIPVWPSIFVTAGLKTGFSMWITLPPQVSTCPTAQAFSDIEQILNDMNPFNPVPIGGINISAASIFFDISWDNWGIIPGGSYQAELAFLDLKVTLIGGGFDIWLGSWSMSEGDVDVGMAAYLTFCVLPVDPYPGWINLTITYEFTVDGYGYSSYYLIPIYNPTTDPIV